MASFLWQQNLEDHNGNDISQLALFGDSAWTFMSAIFESGSDRLLTSGNISFCNSISLQFKRSTNAFPNTDLSNPNSHPVKRVPSPILSQPSKEQLEKSRNH